MSELENIPRNERKRRLSLRRKLLLTVTIIAVLSIVGAVYANSVWTQNITWTYATENTSFTVNPPNTSWNLGTVIGTQTFNQTYIVISTANVPILVNASVATTGLATATITPAAPAFETLASAGDTATFNFTLTVTGAGTCDVTFKSTKVP